ncbi:TRAP transporter substrate-binding protein [Enterovibrio sp. ZSDZ35]|uniref:TRAP transporter substrate-binding protein n=1 Tax=Enterovibrio qingdaonensis TaxID=2899818 RepID=A0ABT5QHH6_9GAMM|nr:TRAP transporter substrate-binding protein [Enterovibrio sp. ZSDZ35]MDD1780429.1 TRAP transporter substrate-binding protein [Enterovibrio sp. ZSDZ35]
MKRVFWRVALGLLVLPTSVMAEVELKIATWLSPAAAMNKTVLPTWGQWIEEATDGRVKIALVYDLGSPNSLIDLVEDGAVDGAWTYHGYFPGQFKLTSLAELPNHNAGSEAVSVAHWQIHEEYLAKAGEHDGVELVGVFTHGPGQIHMREPLDSLEDIKGKKIRVGGGIQSAIGERLGVTGVAAPANKIYEMLTQGVVDGVFNPMSTKTTLKLHEVAPYTLKLPHGMYLGSFGIFLSEDALDELSDKDRDAIMAVSGERLSAMAAKAWADADDYAEGIAREKGNQIVDASSQDLAYFAAVTGDLDQAWVESVNDRDVDANAALNAFRDAAQAYEVSNGQQ